MPERLLLIGQPALLSRLERQMALLDAPPTVVGWVDAAASPSGGPDQPASSSLGGLDDLEATLATVAPLDAAVVCLPAAMADLVAEIRTRLRRAGTPDRFVPRLEDLIAGIGPRNLVEPEPADLLGRPARPLDHAAAAEVITGRRVLITGAGGSIGGELARLAAAHAPDALILMERSENALFEIDRRIAMVAPELPRRAILHDVVDAERTREYFDALRPDVVFHAAAHKHVPMMEEHPAAAIDNNLFGTVAVLEAAVHAGAGRFVLISTDKAVHPVSVMGMTKRLAELAVRATDAATATTTCSMVRFGNVLGSSGSVLETWGRQLRAGGPITVTDPRMTRYFMTIPEAASLVIEAAGLVAPGRPRGEVFVLDMGDPVSIDTFARRFIRSHGLEPVATEAGVPAGAAATPTAPTAPAGTVRIVYSGARPGEKLHEDLGHDAPSMRPTTHPGINAWGEAIPPADLVEAFLTALHSRRRARDGRLLVQELRRFTSRADAILRESNGQEAPGAIPVLQRDEDAVA